MQNVSKKNVDTVSAKNQMSAIEMIANRRREQKKESVPTENQSSLIREVTVNNFFTDDDPKGYTTKEEFRAIVEETLRHFELQRLELFLTQISQKIPLDIPPISKPWEVTKREYYPVRHRTKTVGRNYNLVKLPFTERLIMDYMFEFANFDLDFNELYFHATAE